MNKQPTFAVSLQQRPRGWFSRNLWWLLPGAILVVVLPVGCCGAAFLWAINSLKSSQPYQMALQRVRVSPQMTEELGQPIEEASWMPTGRFSYRSTNGVARGDASFNFSVAGPRGAAEVHADAVCRQGKWQLTRLLATPARTGSTLSLPTDDNDDDKADER